MPLHNKDATLSHDTVFEGALQLLQPRKGHRAGTDGVLLAAMTPAGARRIADLGASTGLVGLRAAQMNPDAQVLLVEREASLTALARQNIVLNALAARVDVLEADIFTLRKHEGLRNGFDCILSNPPYFSYDAVRHSPDPARAGAHVFAQGSDGLEGWIKAAASLAAPHGICILIHRVEAIDTLIPAFTRRFGGATLRFIHPKAGEAAIRLLLYGIKGSRAPLRVLPPLVLHEADGNFTHEAVRLHQGTMRLS